MNLRVSLDQGFNKKYQDVEHTVRLSGDYTPAVVIKSAGDYVAIELDSARTFAKAILALTGDKPAPPPKPVFKVTYQSAFGYAKKVTGTDFNMDFQKWYLTIDGSRFGRPVATLISFEKA